MIENHDKNQVIMSVENYEALVIASSKGIGMLPRELNRIKRHVRKFNSPQKEKRAAQLKDEETRKWCLRQEATKLVKTHEGKTVIVLYKYPDKAPVGVPGTLKGYSSHGVGFVAVRLHSREMKRCIHLLAEFVLSVEEYESMQQVDIAERRREAFKQLAEEYPSASFVHELRPQS